MTITTQTIKSIRDDMREDKISSDLQRIESLAWLLFLKIFDKLEEEWELENEKYISKIPEKFRWRNWAKNDEGITGDKLIEFITELFKELKNLNLSPKEDKRSFIVKRVFNDLYNYFQKGSVLRKVVNKIETNFNFTTKEDRHIFNDIYETILWEMNDASSKGEFYTPRPVTQFIVDMINPKLGETILDPACGTGGFLICAIEKLKENVKNIKNFNKFQNQIKGIEYKPLPHLLAEINFLSHGIHIPNLKYDTAFFKPLKDIEDEDKVDIIVTNPPFGGTIADEELVNFPSKYKTKSSEDLFFILIMKLLKENGKCGIILPDGFLFGEGITTIIKKDLLENFNLHTIVKLPKGVFLKAGIETNILFFDKTKPTKEIWYFQHPYPEGYKTYSKTKQIRYEEFELEKSWWNKRVENDNCWKIDIKKIKEKNYNLDFKNPNNIVKEEILDTQKIIEKLENSFKESNLILKKLN
jgi:type I restriction enzyme M protein